MIEYAIESLAGIPSIIYGLTGMLIFCQFFSLKTSLLSGALTLVIMNLPTIIRTVQESLKTVPQGYREGGVSLSLVVPSGSACAQAKPEGAVIPAGGALYAPGRGSSCAPVRATLGFAESARPGWQCDFAPQANALNRSCECRR